MPTLYREIFSGYTHQRGSYTDRILEPAGVLDKNETIKTLSVNVGFFVADSTPLVLYRLSAHRLIYELSLRLTLSQVPLDHNCVILVLHEGAIGLISNFIVI